MAQVATHVVLWNETQPVLANSQASFIGDQSSATAILTDVVAQPHPHGPKPLQLVSGSIDNVPHNHLDVVNLFLLQLKHTRTKKRSQVYVSKLQLFIASSFKLHPQCASVSWSAMNKLIQSTLSLLITVSFPRGVFCQSVFDCV